MRRRRDPYGDPYDRPRRRYADGGTVDDDDTLSNTAMIQVTPPTPEALSRASGFVQQRQAAIDARDKEVRDIQEKQQLNADQMGKILDETRDAIKRGRSGTNTAMLKMGAAMMTTPGHFGTSVGAGLGALAKGIDEDRAAEAGDEFKMADLQIKKMTLQNAPLEQRMAYIKALQTGDIAAMRSIETALVKAQLAGTKSTQTTLEKNYQRWLEDPKNAGKSLADYQKFVATLKPTTEEREWRLWQEEPGNEGKPFSKYKEWLQGVQARTPADLQYQEQINKERAAKGEPPLSLSEAIAHKKAAETSASTTAKKEAEAQVQAKLDLPQTEQDVNNMIRSIGDIANNPRLKDYIGPYAGRDFGIANELVAKGKQDFILQHQKLANEVFPLAIRPLVGLGAMTEREGEAMRLSFAQLSTLQSEKQFRQELMRLQQKLQERLEIARQKAKANSPVGAAVPPSTGSPSPPNQTGRTPTPPPQPGEPTATNRTTGKKSVFRNGTWIELD